MKGLICMDPKQKLEELEAKVIEHGLYKLASLVAAGCDGKWFKKCEVRHIEEQTKLCHRLRSLINKESSPVVK